MRLQNKTAVSHLAYFLENYCQIEDKVMVISNTKDMIALAKAAMATVKLSYVEYTNNLRSLPAPTTLEKKSILNKWRNNAQVLLTDCRCCRGMECKEVIRLWRISLWFLLNSTIFTQFILSFKSNRLLSYGMKKITTVSICSENQSLALDHYFKLSLAKQVGLQLFN